MDMCVGHLQTEHCLAHLHTGEGTLDGYSHFLGKHLEGGNLIVVHIEYVVYFSTGNDQRVALHQRVDVKERIEAVVGSTLVARYLTGCDFRKNIHIVLY